MRPVLKRGLLPVWRDRDTLQIGIDPRRAVALTGMAGLAWVVGLLDGSRDRAQVIETAADHGIPPEATERVLAVLATAGALDDFPAGTLRLLPPPLRARLAAELAAASLAHRDGDGGARTLARRLTAHVRVYGAGPVGIGLASLLAASGVGRVTPAAPPPGETTPSRAGTSRPAASTPATGRPGTAKSGAARSGTASSGAARSCTAKSSAAESGTAPSGPGLPDLAVLVGRHPMDLRADLMRSQVPHLAVAADEAIGIVGPLVIPGRTACLRCLDLTRAERDPAWPLILAQLEGRQPDPQACGAPLAAAVAAHAAAQALAFIDLPAEAAAVANGTLELVLPSWQWRRRTWPPHPDCGCGSR